MGHRATTNRLLSTIVVVSVLVGGFLCLVGLLPPNVSAGTDHYWIGTTTDATVAANWQPASVPVDTDNLYFSALSAGNCAFNLTGSYGSFNLLSNFTRVITQSANFSIASYSQAAGTFTGSTSYVLTITGGGSIAKTAGTFTSSVTRLTMANDGGAISLSGMALYDLTISGSTTLGLDLLVGHDLTVDGGKILTVPAGTGLTWREWNGGAFSNSGTIAGASVLYFETTASSRTITFGDVSITGVTVFVKSGGTSNTLTLGGNTSLTGTGTFTIYSVQAGQIQTLDTNGHALSFTNIVIGSGGSLLSRTSTLICAGNWDSSSGTYTQNTSLVKMTGATKTLKTAPLESFYDFQVSGTISTTSSVNVSHNITLDSYKSLNIGTALTFDWNASGGGSYSNLGSVSGAGTLVYSLDTSDKSLTFGFTNVNMMIRAKNTASGTRTLTMTGSTFFAWKLTLQSDHATYSMIFDTTSGNATIGMTFTNGTRGIVYYSYPWNILGLVTTSYYYQVGETGGTYYTVNMLTHDVEMSESGYADNVTQYAINSALVNGTVNFLSGTFVFFCGNDFNVGAPGPGVAYAGWNSSVVVNNAHNLTISASSGSELKFRDGLSVVGAKGTAIFIIYGTSDNVTIEDINMVSSTGLSSMYQMLVFNYYDKYGITIQNCTFTALNRVIWDDGDPNLGANNRFINNHFSGGSLVMSLHNNPSGVLISGNVFESTSSSLMIDSVANVTLSNNTFVNSGYGSTFCIDIWDGSWNITVENNTFDGDATLGTSWGVLIDGNYSGKTPPATDPFDIYIYNNTFQEFKKGIVIQGANTTLINDNNFLSTKLPITDNGTGTSINGNVNYTSGSLTLDYGHIYPTGGFEFAISSPIPLINVTIIASTGNDLIWSVDVGSSSPSVSFTLSELNEGEGYKTYVDGVQILQQLKGPTSLTFTYSGPWSEHTFEVRSWEITPNSGPTASFQYTIDGNLLTCTDQSYGPVSMWIWNFGDGTGSTKQSPTHQYSASGKYVISLTVYDSKGHSSMAKTEIEIKLGPDFPVERGKGGWNVFVSDSLTISVSAIGLLVVGSIMYASAIFLPAIPVITAKGRKVIGFIMILAGLYFLIFVDNSWMRF